MSAQVQNLFIYTGGHARVRALRAACLHLEEAKDPYKTLEAVP